MSHQMIFKRHELKYILTREQQLMIKKAMHDYMIPDVHGKSTIQSLYFDTDDYLLIRRSMDHPLYKEKLRLRSYGVATADSTVFMELKKKFNSIVYKRRIEMKESEARSYIQTGTKPGDSQILQEIDYCFLHYPNLSPRFLLSYEREAFYAIADHEFRVTFDENILWRTTDLNLTSGIYGSEVLSRELVLMEVKAADAIPLWFVQALTENHIYKTSFSKYGTAYQKNFNLLNGGINNYA